MSSKRLVLFRYLLERLQRYMLILTFKSQFMVFCCQVITLYIFFTPNVDQELLRQNLNSHFLNSQEREGRRSVPGAENNGAAAGRSTPGGPSASNSGPGSSGRSSANQTSIPPLAFQFHQHNHQHQHTHTHQHFTPFLHPTATAPPLVRCPLLLLRT